MVYVVEYTKSYEACVVASWEFENSIEATLFLENCACHSTDAFARFSLHKEKRDE